MKTLNFIIENVYLKKLIYKKIIELLNISNNFKKNKYKLIKCERKSKMNYLWPILILISFIFSLISGNIENVNNSIFSSVSDVIQLTLTLLGNMCLWCGIIKIIQSTKIIVYLKKVLRPILNWLFKDAKGNESAMEAISINTISNIIGIGNAATSSGLKAMNELQKENKNKEKLTDSMVMLMVLNTTSIQILPTSIMAIRASLGAQNPAGIIVPIWISTIVGTSVGIIATKILLKRNK